MALPQVPHRDCIAGAEKFDCAGFLYLAVRGGYAGAIAGQDESASKMTPAQIEQALMLAQEFKPQLTINPGEFDQSGGS